MSVALAVAFLAWPAVLGTACIARTMRALLAVLRPLHARLGALTGRTPVCLAAPWRLLHGLLAHA